MSPPPHQAHGPEDLCATGTALYERALREGYVRSVDATAAPCLIDFGLMYPAVANLSRLEPVAAVVALHQF